MEMEEVLVVVTLRDNQTVDAQVYRGDETMSHKDMLKNAKAAFDANLKCDRENILDYEWSDEDAFGYMNYKDGSRVEYCFTYSWHI